MQTLISQFNSFIDIMLDLYHPLPAGMTADFRALSAYLRSYTPED